MLPGDSAVQQEAQPVVTKIAEAVSDPQDFLISRLTASVGPLLIRPVWK